MEIKQVYVFQKGKKNIIPAAVIPVASPSASRTPMTKNRHFGMPNISFVTIPVLYLTDSIAK